MVCFLPWREVLCMWQGKKLGFMHCAYAKEKVLGYLCDVPGWGGSQAAPTVHVAEEGGLLHGKQSM